ncbi:Ubiquitin carboxyl-terminal hydrolase-related protein [Raphanus sativus]|uniref:Uncharacterized protein LOC108829914 n=1 Tax=Raphanus sativus TaxID=3726 RepID=A0A9W3CNQ9_RAPSA|nr:uncharacterized protein LOC108829914 [Raphanus sativus]KAJ4909947.1 Ubiquitin carboxyl-terminal hydrolase-related protein [Raphanus sativus]
METAYFVEDDEEAQRIQQLSADYIAQGDHIKALEAIETWMSSPHNKKNKALYFFSFQQGQIFSKQAKRAENIHAKFAFLLGSAECYSANGGFSSFCAAQLFDLGGLIGSPLYLKKSVGKAKEYISLLASFAGLSSQEEKSLRDVKSILKAAESRIAAGSPRDPEVSVAKNNEEKNESDFVRGLRSYWLGLNVEVKRKFMEVSIEDFTSYVQRFYGTEGRDALEKVLSSAVDNKKWRRWVCRSCSEEFLPLKKFKNHLEKEHDAKFKPSTAEHMAQMVDEAWAGMITVAGWEPVDTAAAVEMIKTRLDFVKAFVYENGWSRDWPLATTDEERSKLLKEIQLLLVLFCERKILSCGLRDWMMRLLIKHLARFEVSKHTLTTECRLVETPQSICFLGRSELEQILDFLKRIKCEREDGKEMISRAVDSFYSGTRVKERIDFDELFSSLLLDKRLLRCEIAQFDDEGTVSFLDPNDHYAKANACGDDIVSWLADHSSGDERFRFPRPVRTHNLDIWVAVLRAVQFTCRTLGTKYAKKLQMLGYDAGLVDAINLCVSENNKRSAPEHQWNKYASLLGDECERKHLVTEARDSFNTRLFFCSVRDALEEAPDPTFDFPDLEDCLKRIHGHKNLSDDIVLKSIDRLRSMVADKVPLVDTKMLLVENSRISLFNDLIRLSAFDYRSYILPPLKEFLLEGIVEDMERKAKLAAAQADRLLEEEMKSPSKKKINKSSKEELAAAQALKLLSENRQDKEKSSGSKKKRRRNKKRTSTSMPGVLDQNVEPVTSPSPKPGEEDSMEYDQQEAANDMQNMPGEDSPSKHLEPAHAEGPLIYNSALAMTLKALCYTEILKEYLVQNRNQFYDHREERVPFAIGNFFTAFVSKQMKEGLYSYLLSDLLSSIEEVYSMTSHAAELLVSILEFWPCWECPEIENVVTHVFTLEEYERMSCSKCKKKPNYPEQSSYGIIMAADSIRDLQCAFGNTKFEDILKMIRMEDKMICDLKTGGCGKANFVHHIISRCPPIFTVVLEWEKHETEKEISETTKALDWEIDMSRLYEGLEPNTKYRLVSMVGCAGEEEEYICLAYKKNRWVSFSHEASSAKEVVGSWKSVVRFCGERKVRPEILFYKALQWPNK